MIQVGSGISKELPIRVKKKVEDIEDMEGFEDEDDFEDEVDDDGEEDSGY